MELDDLLFDDEDEDFDLELLLDDFERDLDSFTTTGVEDSNTGSMEVKLKSAAE